MPSIQRARNWCFTINNPTPEDLPELDKWSASYIIYQKEAGLVGTFHFQGYAEFPKKMTLGGLKKINPRAHWEPRKGTQEQAIAYCTKEDTRMEAPVELGERKNQGKRTDIELFVEKLDEGESMKTVSGMFPATFVKYSRGLREYKILHSQPYEHSDVRGLWLHGEPGTGKSRYAAENYPDAYRKQQNKWFDGYDGEKVIVLDDLDTSTLGHHLKIWADRYACLGETKGGQVQLSHELFIVTSNYSIDELFPDDQKLVKALKRRFKCEEFKKLGEKKSYKSMLINP